MTRRAALLLVACLLAACLPQGMRLPQSPLLAAFERKSGLIVLIGEDGNMYTTDQGGGDLLPLTKDAAQLSDAGAGVVYGLPTWSPTDRRLAYARYEFTDHRLIASDVFVAEAPQGEPRSLYSDSDEYPIFIYWSPDGSQLSFLTANQADDLYLLWVVAASGGEPRVVDAGQPVYWTWAPDGRHILAHLDGAASENPGKARVSWITIGQDVREQGLGLSPLSFQTPSLDPSGELALVAASVPDAERDTGLLVTGLDGGVRAVAAAVSDGAVFSWAPKGPYAAYFDPEPNAPLPIGKLQILDLTEPEAPRTTVLGDELVIGFSWSPDGEKLAYFVPVSADTGDQPANANKSTVLLRLYVADARRGTSRQVGVIVPTDAFWSLLPFFDQYQHAVRLWSPDSSYLVFSTVIPNENRQAVFVVPASGTVEPRLLTGGTLGFWSWK